MLLKREEILLLFDIDGTLTLPRTEIEKDLETFLYEKIKPIATIGLITGADLDKIVEQMLSKEKIFQNFDFIFPENGLVQIHNGIEINKESIQKLLGEDTLQKFINYVLKYLSTNLRNLPFKRGKFLEFRNGMMNICPIGRQCTKDERRIFSNYDKVHHIRENMINDLKKEFHNINLTYSIGGEISFDVYPHGWDKSYCLKYITENFNFQEIHFFGDKTEPGGNDHEIYIDNRVIDWA